MSLNSEFTGSYKKKCKSTVTSLSSLTACFNCAKFMTQSAFFTPINTQNNAIFLGVRKQNISPQF